MRTKEKLSRMSRAQNAMRLIKHETNRCNNFLALFVKRISFMKLQRQFALERKPVISDLASILLLDLLKTSLELIDTHHTVYAFFVGPEVSHYTPKREKEHKFGVARTKLISAHTLLLSECFLLFLNSFDVHACRLSPFSEFVTHFKRVLTCKTCVGSSPAFYNPLDRLN